MASLEGQRRNYIISKKNCINRVEERTVSKEYDNIY